MATNFWTKLTITRLPQKIIARCFHLLPISGPGYAMVSCKFSPEDPCCHGNQLFLFKDKICCRLTRASNTETQQLGYIAWQWDRYLVPQNPFLVVDSSLSVCLFRLRQVFWRRLLTSVPDNSDLKHEQTTSNSTFSVYRFFSFVVGLVDRFVIGLRVWCSIFLQLVLFSGNFHLPSLFFDPRRCWVTVSG